MSIQSVRSALLRGWVPGAFLAAFAAVPAIAQSTESGPTSDKPNAEEQDIVVTARKREERLIDVPIAVSVVSGQALEQAGIQDVKGLYGRVPSLYYSVNNSRTGQKDQTYLVLRGVGANPVLEPSVGVFIDGVYQPSVGFDIGFLDLDRVEVLRGPQGALFGRNTEGGALNVVTRKPGDEFAGRLSVEGDELLSGQLRASVSGPLSEKVSAGIAVQARGTEGYVENSTRDAHQDNSRAYSARLALRFRPAEATDINLSVDGTTKRGRTVGAGVPVGSGKSYVVTDDFEGSFKDDQWGAGLSIEHEFGGAKLASLTGYRNADTRYGFDADGTGLFLGNFQNAFTKQYLLSQELRLESNGAGAFSWLGGVYLFKQRDDTRTQSEFADLFGPPTATVALRSIQDRKGFAFFGQASLKVIPDTLDVSAGLRYSKENVDGTRSSFLDIPSFGLTRNVAGTSKASYSDWSPTFQASLALAPRVKLYANIAKGFKAGGYEKFPGTSDPYLPIAAESSWNYEAGLKGSIAGTINFTAAVYQIDISNLQLPTLVIDPNTGLPSGRIDSAGSARTRGFELEADIKLSSAFSITGSLGHTSAKFRQFVDADGTQRAGDPVPNIPRWTFNVGARLDQPITQNLDLVGSVNYRHVGNYQSGLGTSGDPQNPIRRYGVADLDLGVENNRFSAGIFVRNLFDKYYVTNIMDLLIGFGPQQQPGAPRVFGVRAGVNF